MTDATNPDQPSFRVQGPTKPYVKATAFMKALHEAGLLPQYPHCSRVVIDAQTGYMVQMFVDQIPNEALLSIAPLMSGSSEYREPEHD